MTAPKSAATSLPAIPEEFLSHEVPRGALFSWDAFGKMFVGSIRGMRDQIGKENKTYQIVDAVSEDGEMIVFTAGKILAGQLAGISPDQRVCIQFLGKTKTGTGNDANDFKVYALPASGK